MKKNEVDILKSTGFKNILFDFSKAKQAIYNYPSEEFNKKIENFFDNIDKITFKLNNHPLKIFEGLYKPSKKELIFNFQIEKNLTSEQMQCLVHELNHVWNYNKMEKIGIIPKSTKRLNNPLDFKLIDEVINEAETQALLSDTLKSQSNKDTNINGKFYGYSQYEPIFEILCILCNQNGIEFLKSIEGKDIYGIISHISEKMSFPKDTVNKEFQKIAGLISKMNFNIAKYNHKNSINYMKSLLKKQEFQSENIEEYVTECQEIYHILKESIQKSGYSEEDKQKITLKFESAYDRMVFNLTENENDKNKLFSQSEYAKNDPEARFEFGKIESDALILTGDYDFVFKDKKEFFLKRILQKFIINKQLLLESNNNNSNNVNEISIMQNTFNAKYRIPINSTLISTKQPFETEVEKNVEKDKEIKFR